MESENLFTLTEDQWQAIERMNDCLAEPSAGGKDLPQALLRALEIVLITLGREGAALYLPRFCEHIPRDWTFYNVPAGWQKSLEERNTPLRGLLERAVQTGTIIPGDESLELGAVLPIQSSQKIFGAILVRGPAVPPEAYARWKVFLRPFARTAALHASISGNHNGIPNYRELMLSRNTLRAMFDSLPISIYIIDHTYTLVAVNHSRAERAEQKPSSLVGGKCYEKLFHRSSPCLACHAAETFAAGRNTTRLSRHWIDSEKFIEWEISTFPIMDEKNQVDQTIVIEQDVTEKRNLESDLIQSEKLAAVGQLAAGVAHEINNPLTAIIANAQILRREIEPADRDTLDSIKLIEMAGTRAAQVVRNLLGVARKERYEIEPIDLNETLHNALSLVQHELIGRPIQVYLDLDDSIPEVMASQDQLQGVWINLILNAIDAVDKEMGEIAVVSRFLNNEFQVTIQDNGKGIAAEHLPRVFEPFFTTKPIGRGTGLGLSVCLRVIRHHGGNIQVESQPGEWTRFTVSLPGPQI